MLPNNKKLIHKNDWQACLNNYNNNGMYFACIINAMLYFQKIQSSLCINMVGYTFSLLVATFSHTLLSKKIISKNTLVQFEQQREFVITKQSSYQKRVIAPIIEEIMYTLPHTIGYAFSKDIQLAVTASYLILPIIFKFNGKKLLLILNSIIWLCKYADYNNTYIDLILKFSSGLLFGIGHGDSTSMSSLWISFWKYSLVYYNNLFISYYVSKYDSPTSGLLFTFICHALNNSLVD